jgi:hypothetical protein
MMPTTIPRALVSWLQMSCGLVCVFGLLLVLAPSVTRQGFSLLVYGTPTAIDAFGAEAARYASLAHAVIGGVMAGWGAGLWLVTRTMIARGSKTGWRLVAVSLGAWYVPDTAYSLAAGFWQNAVLNTMFAMLFAAPLAFLYRHVRDEG